MENDLWKEAEDKIGRFWKMSLIFGFDHDLCTLSQ